MRPISAVQVGVDVHRKLTLRSARDSTQGGSWPGAFSKAVRCPTIGVGVLAMITAESNVLVLPLIKAVLSALAPRRRTS